jgi:hypothetical protein
MATACFCGLPAAISVFTFLRKAAEEGDLTSGMSVLKNAVYDRSNDQKRS